MKLIDLTGKRFGRLVVLGQAPAAPGNPRWHCRCDCGTEKSIRGSHLREGKIVSCGCFAIDEMKARATHGMSRTSTHIIWKTMRARCYNPRSSGYAGYGARGITVCDAWKSFKNFLADMGERPPGMSIERIDNNKGYEPGNCKWATNGEQCRNRRSTKLITYNGQTKCRQDWANELGISPQMLLRRINRLGVDAAFETFKGK